jgi:ABC-type sugar transport system permease subunit
MAIETEQCASAVPQRPVHERRQRRWLLDHEGFLAPTLLLPSIIYIIGLVAIPFLLAIAFALSNVTVGDPSYGFVGLRNFATILRDPPSAGRSATACCSPRSR